MDIYTSAEMKRQTSGVVVAGGEIVEAGFGIVVVAAITERVVCAKCSCQGAGGGYQLAPRIVDIFYHTHAAFVHKANYIILAVSQVIVFRAVVGFCITRTGTPQQ